MTIPATPPAAFNFAPHLIEINAARPAKVACVDDHGTRFIEFVDELPKTATGNIQRFRLRERERNA
jgi:acyl-CoA synthetase (AMP-forming)/AMP-acid ligase II